MQRRTYKIGKEVQLIFLHIHRLYNYRYNTIHYGNTGCGVFKQGGGTKLERFLPKNQHTQRKLLNFQNWCSGELSKIGHHFSNKVV